MILPEEFELVLLIKIKSPTRFGLVARATAQSLKGPGLLVDKLSLIDQ